MYDRPGRDDPAPLILTLVLDHSSQAFFDRQRERWFPAKLNFIPAHVTMFHHLPGERSVSVREHLELLCAGQTSAEVAVTGLRSLGRGVAYDVRAPEMEVLRSRIAGRWRDHLTAQDQRPWQPHVTVQNKVSPAEAKDLLGQLARDFIPFTATATGIAIWRYCGGPWESDAVVPFNSSDPPMS
jgi:2'-5' RNA ligase